MNKKKKKKSGLPFRLNIIFIGVFILFSVLVIQLGIVQILEGKSYQEKIDQTISDTAKSPVPRGKIYDRAGNVVVDNDPLYSITYTPPKRVQAEDKLKVAKNLTNFITLKDEALDKITERNEKEYWYLENIDEANDRLTDKEKKLDDVEQYDIALKKITDEDLKEITDKERQIIGIKRELDKAYALTPEVIKNEDISVEEYAKIAEHLSQLDGVNATTDWNRKYKYKDTLKSILGSITSQEEGIPKEKEDYYLTRGYNRNDRVGKSGLEQEYEDVLRGRKEVVEYTTTKSGDVIGTDIAVEGERGKDLILSMDMEFQEKVDDILESELKKVRSKHPAKNRYAEDAWAVAMNPKTGDILSLSGVHYDKEDNKYKKMPHKTLYDATEPGSSIKGATVLAGLQSEVIKPGEVLSDSKIKIASGTPKGSWKYLGSVDDIGALKQSSNVYMFYIGLRLGGDFRYPYPNGSPTNASAEKTVTTLRSYYNQFGLGVNTGIDYPYETTGVQPNSNFTSGLTDEGIGQFDTFSTMQLAQYVSTIANDGYRVKPHLVKEIRNPSIDDELGSIYKVNETEVMDKINIKDEYIDRVQTGFWKAFNEQGGTGYTYWNDAPYKPAGKTGTAETRVEGTDVENLALVGYAPYDDPEIAFAVIVPQLGSGSGEAVNHAIGRGIMDAYFDIKKDDDDDEED